MNDHALRHAPATLTSMLLDTGKIGFQMRSEPAVGALLRTLAASKPQGRFLDLGTGTGLSAAWLLDGMGPEGSLLSVDCDPLVLEVAQRHLGHDERLRLVCDDGDHFIAQLAAQGERFDLIFADTWAGKYRLLDEALNMLKPGGLYIVDDMLPQPNWPDDHPPKVQALITSLTSRSDLRVARLDWSCGVMICARL